MVLISDEGQLAGYTNFRRGFYDGSEGNPLVSKFWPWIDWHQIFGEGFMMAVKSIVSNFWPWLDWHQIFDEGFMMAVKSIVSIFGHGSIGTKFSARVSIFGHGSIGTKFSVRVL